VGGPKSSEGEDIMIIRPGLAPEVAPLPVAQVQFTGLRLLSVQQHAGTSEMFSLSACSTAFMSVL